MTVSSAATSQSSLTVAATFAPGLAENSSVPHRVAYTDSTCNKPTNGDSSSSEGRHISGSRSADEATAELAHDRVLLDACGGHGDLTAHRSVTAQVHGRQEAPKRRKTRKVANGTADGGKRRLMLTPHVVHGLARNRDPTARFAGDRDHPSRVRMTLRAARTSTRNATLQGRSAATPARKCSCRQRQGANGGLAGPFPSRWGDERLHLQATAPLGRSVNRRDQVGLRPPPQAVGQTA